MATKAKKMRFRSQNERNPDPGEKNLSISLTVPDQAMSVREIMVRFANGTLPDISRDINYSEDLPDLRGLEPWQIQEMITENTMEIKRMENDLKKRELEKREQEIEKRAEERYLNNLRSREKQVEPKNQQNDDN